ncbi:MAG: hypothetical protein ACRDJH_17445 [Thermomicrobiales bacterium]
MQKLLISTVLAVMLTPFLLPATANAEVAFRIKFRGLTAHAAFSSADSADPCLITEVFVFATADAVQGPAPEAFANVAIFRSNDCTGTHLQTLIGSTTAPDFRGDRPLTFASLAATITVEEFTSGEQFDVFVDLAWTGTGDPSRENGHFHVQRPGFNASGHFNATTRQAVASGSITDGVADFTGGEPSEDVLGLMVPELEWASVGLIDVAIG